MERSRLLPGRLRAAIQEIPYQYGVIVRTADDLEFVELQSEYAARVFLQKPNELIKYCAEATSKHAYGSLCRSITLCEGYIRLNTAMGLLCQRGLFQFFFMPKQVSYANGIVPVFLGIRRLIFSGRFH